MNSALPEQSVTNNDIDGELVLVFLTEFRSLEQALTRAGFTRAGPTPGNVQPDWVRFVRHIEGRFRPDSSPDLQEAVSYLLYEPDKRQLRRKRLQGSFPGETSSAHSDIVWLSELVQETGNQLIHGINFPQNPGYDPEHVMAALMVVAAWSCCDPIVESQLTHVQ